MDHREGGRQINLPPASAGAGEKPAGAGEKSAGPQKDTASRADLTQINVVPIVVPVEQALAAALLAVEIDVQRTQPRNAQFAIARKSLRTTLIKVRRWVVAGQWRAVTVVRGLSKCWCAINDNDGWCLVVPARSGEHNRRVIRCCYKGGQMV